MLGFLFFCERISRRGLRDSFGISQFRVKSKISKAKKEASGRRVRILRTDSWHASGCIFS